MKPIVLTNIKPSLDLAASLACVIKRQYSPACLGGVEASAIERSHPLMMQLSEVGTEHGFAPKTRPLWAENTALAVAGSVPWHDDWGVGLLLSWMVASNDLNGFRDCVDQNDCYLMTRHGALRITVGDVFVFNGDFGHAWLSNSNCCLIQATVKKLRTPKTA